MHCVWLLHLENGRYLWTKNFRGFDILNILSSLKYILILIRIRINQKISSYFSPQIETHALDTLRVSQVPHSNKYPHLLVPRAPEKTEFHSNPDPHPANISINKENTTRLPTQEGQRKIITRYLDDRPPPPAVRAALMASWKPGDAAKGALALSFTPPELVALLTLARALLQRRGINVTDASRDPGD